MRIIKLEDTFKLIRKSWHDELAATTLMQSQHPQQWTAERIEGLKTAIALPEPLTVEAVRLCVNGYGWNFEECAECGREDCDTLIKFDYEKSVGEYADQAVLCLDCLRKAVELAKLC